MKRDRIALAYSGSVTTSAAIRWLSDAYAADVVTLTLDLGAGGELQEVHERALAIGALRAHVIDVSEEFANDYVLPALQAGALRPGGETLAALARPLVARKLLEIARIERAAAVAHGSSAPGLDTLINALDPEMRIIAPVRQWGMTRADVIDYARRLNVTLPAGAARKLTPATPEIAADVEIGFDEGVPVSINGVPMSLTELIESLTIIAAQHGVTGAGDFTGAPAIVLLQDAFNARLRDEAASVVRLTLLNGATTATVVPSSELAAPRS